MQQKANYGPVLAMILGLAWWVGMVGGRPLRPFGGGRGRIGAESSLVKGHVSGRERPGRHDPDLGLALEGRRGRVRKREVITVLLSV